MDSINILKEFLIANNKGIPALMAEAQKEFGAFVWTQYENIIILTMCQNKNLEGVIFHRKGWEIMYHPVVGITGTVIFFSQKENKWHSYYNAHPTSLVESIRDKNFEYTLDTAGEIIVKYDRSLGRVVYNRIKDNLISGIVGDVTRNAKPTNRPE